MSTSGIAGARTPFQGWPSSAASPSPNSVSARPVATWLDRSHSTSTANSTDSPAPPAAAPAKPTRADPESEAAMKPVIAPVIIIPSTPRFRTPARSTTSSPSAARRIGRRRHHEGGEEEEGVDGGEVHARASAGLAAGAPRRACRTRTR